jgi:hypothetical protein
MTRDGPAACVVPDPTGRPGDPLLWRARRRTSWSTTASTTWSASETPIGSGSHWIGRAARPGEGLSDHGAARLGRADPRAPSRCCRASHVDRVRGVWRQGRAVPRAPPCAVTTPTPSTRSASAASRRGCSLDRRPCRIGASAAKRRNPAYRAAPRWQRRQCRPHRRLVGVRPKLAKATLDRRQGVRGRQTRFTRSQRTENIDAVSGQGSA